ncbi:MAG: hypothetical protein IID41_00270 [Planctomycetes bacterium]|nr:hypothetical protein [Planctomycetota bacterium]
MKIKRTWLRIIVSAIGGGIAGYAVYRLGLIVISRSGGSAQRWLVMFFLLSIFSTGPIATAVLAHVLTPKEILDGHTRCGKCGYILKGLTEPRCSECGERI